VIFAAVTTKNAVFWDVTPYNVLMFTDVSEERPTCDDGNVGKRLENHIPEDYLNDRGKMQSLVPSGRLFFAATNWGQEGQLIQSSGKSNAEVGH
jgi:hypothetical protein